MFFKVVKIKANCFQDLYSTRNQDLWSCSRILGVALCLAKGVLRLLNNFYNTLFQKIFMLFWPSEESFWLLLTSITSEVINDQAHVTTQRILNKFIEVHKLFLACTFGCDAVYSKAMKLKLLIRFNFFEN